MLHTKLMTIARATLAASSHLAKVPLLAHLPNTRFLPKALAKVNLLVYMTNLVIFYGHDISSRLKDIQFQLTLFIKTI
jgi:hypothetical protein